MVDSHTLFHAHITETPQGAVDSTNTTFVLSYAPDSTSNIRFFINGLQQFEGVDFTVGYDDPRILTLNEAPLHTGPRVDEVMVEYTKGTDFGR